MQTLTIADAMDSADNDLFQGLRRELEHDIASYVYENPENAIGTPLSADHVRALLNSMHASLVEPRWEEVNICNTSQQALAGKGVMRKCVTMAQEDGYVLVFDPVDHEYHLAWRGINGLGTWGVRGDGVDCFLSR